MSSPLCGIASIFISFSYRLRCKTSQRNVGTTNIAVTIDALTDRHPISQYVYGGAYPENVSTIYR